jgi:hypothetical protein
MRVTQKMGGTGSGAAGRFYAYAYGATASSLYGVESTAEIHTTTSSAHSGEMCAYKGTATVNLSTSGTVYPMHLTINTASGKTMHGNSAFIAIDNSGSGTDIPYLFHIQDAIGTTSAATIVSTTSNDNTTHAVKIRAGSTDLWLQATSTTPH